MPPVLRFIGQSWTFLLKQPALVRACLWLVFLPFLATGFLELIPLTSDVAEYEALLLFVLEIVFIVLTYWGMACVLTVGRRLLQAKAGRTRTSFRAVQAQARGLIVALLLTDLLRLCIAILFGLPLVALIIVSMVLADGAGIDFFAYVQQYPWLAAPAVLFLLPPAWYFIRTALTPMVVAYEKVGFRPALTRSKQLTKGRFWDTVAMQIILGLLFVPSLLISLALPYAVADSTIAIINPITTALFDTVAATIWLLAFTLYYKALGGKTKHSEND